MILSVVHEHYSAQFYVTCKEGQVSIIHFIPVRAIALVALTWSEAGLKELAVFSSFSKFKSFSYGSYVFLLSNFQWITEIVRF